MVERSSKRSSDDDRLVRLILRYQDGELTAPEQAELNAALESDRHAQRVFVAMSYQDGLLSETLGPEVPVPEPAPPEKTSEDSTEEIAQALAFYPTSTEPAGQSVWGSDLKSAGRFSASRMAPFALAASLIAAMIVGLIWQTTRPTGQPTARLIREVDAEWADQLHLQAGDRLGESLLRLRTGIVEIEFGNGARIVLEGPAALQIQSASEATLKRGMLSAIVPKRAIGFVIHTPETKVVDLGTEFGVQVDDDGLTEIHVFRGKVEAAVARPGKRPVALRTDQAVRLEQKGGDFHKIESYPEQFIRSLVSPELAVPDAYRLAVQDSAPMLYWDFEKTEGGRVLNRIADRLHGRIHGAILPAGPGNHVLECSQVDIDRAPAAVLDGVLTPLDGKDEYSIEFWFYTHRTHHGTILSMLSMEGAKNKNSPNQAGFIELLPGRTIGQVRSLGSDSFKKIRFTHRSKPSHSNAGNINTVSPRHYLTKRWYHAVAVKEAAHLSVYLDGRRILTQSDKKTRPLPGDLWFEIGRLIEGKGRKARPFNGRIDEIAIYNRPLSPYEIKKHHALMGLQRENVKQQP